MAEHIFYSSIFGELTKQVQVRIDAASELRKRLFDQNIYERYLTWDVPTIGLNFEEQRFKIFFELGGKLIVLRALLFVSDYPGSDQSLAL